MSDYWAEVKGRDPYQFKKADEFFRDFDNAAETKRPKSITCRGHDQKLQNGDDNSATKYGRIFRFDDNSLLLIQFVRPKVWRITFDPSYKDGHDISDHNSRTIVTDTLTTLIETLNEREGVNWHVDLVTNIDAHYYILQSVIEKDDGVHEPAMQLWIQRDPFQISAIRSVESMPPIDNLPVIEDGMVQASDLDRIRLESQPGVHRASFWRTKERPLRYDSRSTLLSVEKPSTADYTGFGEQGGKSFFKKQTYLNFFNFDNMKYQNVYGGGPYDNREPLYHSEPYWLEMDGLPSCKSQVATFVDNYSHVCIDIGMQDETAIRMATRFNTFAAIFIAGDSISEIIQSYTSIIGRPRLKPRYVLGNHQGGYGYDTKEMVLEVAKKYRDYQIPLDGLHVDVDMQEDYRTFTIDKREGHFNQPDQMFADLRKLGIKCSTNITPYISSAKNPEFTEEYRTYQQGIDKNYFITDERDVDPSAPHPDNVRYQQWGGGKVYYTNPSSEVPEYWDHDDYEFPATFNSGQPFHGGVYYGWRNGHPGHYPNLNNKEVRRWWGAQYQYLFEQGLDFVWQDMTSPCIAEQYGDMKGLPFRLLLDNDGRSGDHSRRAKRKAIEIWHLYSYNLHKATYHGLNNLHQHSAQLAWRGNRRNFIIGRGSFAGMHRYAGLWTGDNASTWEFLDISVAQVLAIGLSGITVSGADVGGFEFMSEQTKSWADPELLIRWYGAYSLLPWFRNHYTKYRDWFDGPNKGKMRKDGKKFQEPYMYSEHPEVPHHEMVYKSVLPICRYLIRLRYSLLQLSYDAMFENMLTGLPIARAMIITDDQDRTLFSDDNQDYTRCQYFLRNDLLVAPALRREAEFDWDQGKPVRKVYLPYPNAWYAMNLRPDEDIGVALSAKTAGGTHVSFDCHISDDGGHIPYVTPMYVREGAIIPKIGVRDYVPDPTLPDLGPNPITIHVYPGRNNTYEMFLDDGISRDSAPTNTFLASYQSVLASTCVTHSHKNKTNGVQTNQAYADKGVDPQAGDKFSKVVIRQQTTRQARVDDDDDGSTAVGIHFTRKLSITCPHDGFRDRLDAFIGTEYSVVFWHDPDTPIDRVHVTTSWPAVDASVDASGKTVESTVTTHSDSRATKVRVPVSLAHRLGGVDINVSWDV